MELVTPGLGILFWQTLTFLIVLALLTKFAWKPITKALRDREASISDALLAAERARSEMQKLQSDNEKLLQEARNERDKILKEAKDAARATVEEAKEKALAEGSRLLEAARTAIQNEKMAALTEVKNQVAVLSLEIAEKLLRKELKEDNAQKALTEKFIGELSLN